MQLLDDPAMAGKCLAQAKELSHSLLAIEADDDGVSWSAEFANGTEALIEWVAQPARLVLSALVGLPAAGREMTIFRTCLSFNALWQESDGAKLALGGDEGELMLIRELHAGAVGEWNLAALLEQFAGTAAAWRRYIVETEMAPPLRFGAATGIVA